MFMIGGKQLLEKKHSEKTLNRLKNNYINIYMTDVEQLYCVLCVSLCTGMYTTFCYIHDKHLQLAPQYVNTHQLVVLERGVMQLLCTGVKRNRS